MILQPLTFEAVYMPGISAYGYVVVEWTDEDSRVFSVDVRVALDDNTVCVDMYDRTDGESVASMCISRLELNEKLDV